MSIKYNELRASWLTIDLARTKKRPLPSGRISVLAATIYLLVQYAAGMAFLFSTLRGIALVKFVSHSDKKLMSIRLD